MVGLPMPQIEVHTRLSKNAHAMPHPFLRCFPPPIFIVPTSTSIDLVASPVFVVFFANFNYFLFGVFVLCAPFGSTRRFNSNAHAQTPTCLHTPDFPRVFSLFFLTGDIYFSQKLDQVLRRGLRAAETPAFGQERNRRLF